MTFALIANLILCLAVVAGVVGHLAFAIFKSRAEAESVTADGTLWRTRPARRPAVRPAPARAPRPISARNQAFGRG